MSVTGPKYVCPREGNWGLDFAHGCGGSDSARDKDGLRIMYVGTQMRRLLLYFEGDGRWKKGDFLRVRFNPVCV
jgi:hypothetical protein